MSRPFVHQVQVRYGECDMQGIVFNANYLLYVDDAVDRWLAERLGSSGYGDGFDCVVKKATLEWASSARHAERIDLAPSVSRWGRTSFDVTVHGRVGDRAVFTATLVYVSVVPGATEPTPVPVPVRDALSG